MYTLSFLTFCPLVAMILRMRRSIPVTRRLAAKDARANFSDVLSRVYYGQEPVIVERKGKPVAVLISPEQWERYQQQTKDRLFEAIDRLQEQNRDADPEEVERDVTEAVEEVRRERYERQHQTGRGA